MVVQLGKLAVVKDEQPRKAETPTFVQTGKSTEVKDRQL